MADITDLIFEDHQWFRRQFFYLDEAKTVEEMTAIWEPLATRLDTHADAEERIFYPALLEEGRRPGRGDRGRDRATTTRSATRSPRPDGTRSTPTPGGRRSNDARKENGEHLEEEEREGLPDFRSSATAALKH